MKLDTLLLWQDTTPHDGALNMALDEAMLMQAEVPWLRVYRWIEPTISIGFSQPMKVVPNEKASWPVVRRWTGGGVVVHDGDWTYTLAVPGNHAVSEQRAVETYRWIHEAMIVALNAVGISGSTLQPESTSDGMGVCFVEPAIFDVVWQGQKIAGAAQRRAKTGFLHQGTIQPVKLPTEFGECFANALSSSVEIVGDSTIESQIMPRALDLAEHKYGTHEWLHDRSAKRPTAP